MKQKHVPTIHVKVYSGSQGSRKWYLSHLSHGFLQDHIFSGDVSNDTVMIQHKSLEPNVRVRRFCLIKNTKNTHTHTHITTSHPKRITNPTHKRLFIYTSFLCIVHALSTANIAIHLVAPGRSTRVEVLQCQKARSVEESANGRQERQKVFLSLRCVGGRKNCKV